MRRSVRSRRQSPLVGASDAPLRRGEGWALQWVAHTGGVLRIDGGLEELDVDDLEGRERGRKSQSLQRPGRLPADRLTHTPSRVARDREVGEGEEQEEALEEVEVFAVAALEEAPLAGRERPGFRLVGHVGQGGGCYATGSRCIRLWRRQLLSGKPGEQEGGGHGGVL